MRSRRLRSLFLVIVVSVSAACVKQDPPGVGVANLKSEIVFGLNPPAVPGFTPAVDLGQFQPDDLGSPSVPPSRILPPPTGQLCGEAFATDTPEEIATTAVDENPGTGDYRWRLRGRITLNGQQVSLLGQFQKRQILNLSPVVESTVPIGGPAITDSIVTRTFSYTMRTELGLAGGGGFEDNVFQVKDNPISISQGVVNFGKPIVVGEPERGVTLKRSTVFLPEGGVYSDFAPAVGVLLLPLPVNIGEEWDSVGVDGINGTAMVLQGKVIKREAVDACGTLVDGWRVEARKTLITPFGAVMANYDYVVATQLGGALVYEHTYAPDITDIRLPSLPAVPGLPQLPGVPALPPLPPLPVPLPVIADDVEATVAQLKPSGGGG